MARASAEQWAKRVERWRDSGLTAKEFAAETGINASTLSYWRWKLSSSPRRQQETPERGAAKRRKPRPMNQRSRKARTQTTTRAPQLVEVPVATVASSPAMLELLLGDVRVRVPDGFDEATLTRVVRAVGAAR